MPKSKPASFGINTQLHLYDKKGDYINTISHSSGYSGLPKKVIIQYLNALIKDINHI